MKTIHLLASLPESDCKRTIPEWIEFLLKLNDALEIRHRADATQVVAFAQKYDIAVAEALEFVADNGGLTDQHFETLATLLVTLREGAASTGTTLREYAEAFYAGTDCFWPPGTA
jgi:hypothetical protein